MNTIAAERIREHALNLTPQRQMIYAHLLGRCDHPSADKVYTALKPDHPHLSKMTVYNVLSALVDHRLVERIHIENDEMRYDANMSFHAHFRCRACETIYDVFPKAGHHKSYLPLPDGFELEDEQVVYYGVCADCKRKQTGGMRSEGLTPSDQEGRKT